MRANGGAGVEGVWHLTMRAVQPCDAINIAVAAGFTTGALYLLRGAVTPQMEGALAKQAPTEPDRMAGAYQLGLSGAKSGKYEIPSFLRLRSISLTRNQKRQSVPQIR